MVSGLAPFVVVSSLHHVDEALKRFEPQYVVSILSGAERMRFAAPLFGNRSVLELRFDDFAYSTGRFVAPDRSHIRSLIEFARQWSGLGSLVVHCFAGSSRSVAAAAIAAAAIGRDDVARHLLGAKSYFRANQKMLEIADNLVVPTPGLKLFAQNIPLADRTDDWEPLGVSLGPRST